MADSFNIDNFIVSKTYEYTINSTLSGTHKKPLTHYK